MNAESLQQGRTHLHHADVVHPERPAVPKLPPLCPDEGTFLRKLKETYLETYYKDIEKFSFRTVFHVMTRAQLERLIKAHEVFLKTQERFAWVKDPAFGELRELAAAVDAAKQSLACEAVFVRLSSRSPKDACLTHPRIEQLYRAELRYLEDFDGLLSAENPEVVNYSVLIDNRRIHALYRSSIAALKVATGNEGVQLLVESDRIQEDLRLALEEFGKPSAVPFQLIVREFRQFNVELEFRAFVMGDKLTALTQYNEQCFFPHLLYKKNYIQELIQDFWRDNLQGKLPSLRDYVLDVVLIPRTRNREDPYSDLQVVVVELNPIGEFAGSGLFRWELQHDNEVLRGLKPFEFRIATEPVQDSVRNLPAAWARVIATAELASPRRHATNPSQAAITKQPPS